MKKYMTLILCVAAIFICWSDVCANDTLQVNVGLKPPATKFKMGDIPVFKGIVTNTGTKPLEGLTVYLSLISLQSGNEHPVDLEDWSAQKAVRIAKLDPGTKSEQDWGMRLIAPGPFAVALTVVGKNAAQPIISDLVKFDINTKPLISSARILPIAIGEPFLLLLLILIFKFSRMLQFKHRANYDI